MVASPCIDVLSPKNRPLDRTVATAVLETAGLLGTAPSSPSGATSAAAPDHRVTRRADVTEDQPVPNGARLVAQVSRWDRLKDPVGVLHAFEAHGPEDESVHLVLAGPADGVADDPEGSAAFAEVREAWAGLHPAVRCRAHLARLPMHDADENATIVNALQRRADVIIQKSLAEGFGLTVAEAMWKRRPVIASAVGGIQDQIVHGESGILVDPLDLAAVGRALASILADEEGAARMGEAAHRRVRDRFLPLHHFAREAELVGRIVRAQGARASLPA
jgi:trehalose synthase